MNGISVTTLRKSIAGRSTQILRGKLGHLVDNVGGFLVASAGLGLSAAQRCHSVAS